MRESEAKRMSKVDFGDSLGMSIVKFRGSFLNFFWQYLWLGSYARAKEISKGPQKYGRSVHLAAEPSKH